MRYDKNKDKTAAVVIREGAKLKPELDFRNFAPQVQQTLSELTDQLTRMRRNWKVALAVLS
ncbi:hypothetical protein FPZ49_03815 [Paenibacillus cremeus]|uniref:Uncharacterized protein n=1 Tax=Paenibacillus cremeus TaxID=2163881 RepID=A0A559KGV6_9BACL|nr:hypothetical protein FPZ49_03815 [Paenibacillus cremeus]